VIQPSPALFTVSWKTALKVMVTMPVGGPLAGSTHGTFVGKDCVTPCTF
jgi:hypothetical protein